MTCEAAKELKSRVDDLELQIKTMKAEAKVAKHKREIFETVLKEDGSKVFRVRDCKLKWEHCGGFGEGGHYVFENDRLVRVKQQAPEVIYPVVEFNTKAEALKFCKEKK